MQIVVNVSEKMYEDCKVRNTGHYFMYDFSSVIANGTPLSKGHGDLIDIDELNLFAEEHEIGNNAYDGKLIYNAGETSRHDTIWKPLSDVLNVVIEADKEVQE